MGLDECVKQLYESQMLHIEKDKRIEELEQRLEANGYKNEADILRRNRDDLLEENQTLQARNAKLEAMKNKIERIQSQAHLAGDHFTYDVMRTILNALDQEDGDDG